MEDMRDTRSNHATATVIHSIILKTSFYRVTEWLNLLIRLHSFISILTLILWNSAHSEHHLSKKSCFSALFAYSLFILVTITFYSPAPFQRFLGQRENEALKPDFSKTKYDKWVVMQYWVSNLIDQTVSIKLSKHSTTQSWCEASAQIHNDVCLCLSVCIVWGSSQLHFIVQFHYIMTNHDTSEISQSMSPSGMSQTDPDTSRLWIR